MVVTRGTFGGTHSGEFFGHAATGNDQSVPFINIMRIENGLNAEEWDAFDTLSFMTQIGAIPGG
jgi:predicted ester cyclase